MAQWVRGRQQWMGGQSREHSDDTHDDDDRHERDCFKDHVCPHLLHCLLRRLLIVQVEVDGHEVRAPMAVRVAQMLVLNAAGNPVTQV